jgi:hypothetical protein
MNYKKEINSRLKDYEGMYSFFNNNYKDIIKNCDKKIILRICHILLQNNIDYAINVIDKIYFDDYSCYSLKVNIYSQKKETLNKALDIIKKIEELYSHMMKKRIYIPILIAYIEWYPEKSFDYLLNISNRFKLNLEDIQSFFKIDCDKEMLFNILSKHNIILNSNPFKKSKLMKINIKCPNCTNKLTKINLTKEENNSLIKNFKKQYLTNDKYLNSIKNMKKYCKNKNYNVFIDGANIMFYFKRKINLQSYERLLQFYNKISELNYNPLIILHKRHKKFPPKQEVVTYILNKMNIYYTPYKMNDDYFFIWQSLNTPNSFVLTNDKLTDHIFKISDEDLDSNTLQKWINNSIITYNTFESNNTINIDLNFPNEISYKTQKNNGFWHIPIKPENWICIKL